MTNTTLLKRATTLGLGASLLAMTSAFAGDLNVWAWDPNFNGAAINKAAEIYKADHPEFNLTFNAFSREEVEQKL